MRPMTASSQAPGTSPPAAASGARAPAAGDRDPAGLLLARLSVAPALIATAFLLVSFPLLVIGEFRPVPVIALSAIAATLLTWRGLLRWRGAVALPGLRVPPDLRSGAAADPRPWAQPGDLADGGDARRTPWWAALSVLVIAGGFFAFQAAHHSQFLVISRDPGAYMQFGAWIAGHGALPIQTSPGAFGGAKGITFGGFAMYQVGTTVVPQFMAGLPMALAVGWWLFGVNGALLTAPLLGAAAVVVFAGLAARLAGARWAPLAALVIAVSEPLMFTSRSTYSEPLALIMFLGGLSLVIDSLRAERGARALALLAGLALGTCLLVRIDAPADALPVIPYAGWLLARGRRQATPMITGLAIGWAGGAWDAIFVTFPYVFQTNKSSSVPMVVIIAVTIVLTVAGAWWLRRRARAARALPRAGEHWLLPTWLPAFLVVLPFCVLAGFAARSHVQPGYAGEHYAQLALHWVYWYLGGPAIALAAVGAAVLSRGCLRGQWPSWALPLMVFSWGIVTFLYRPGITPDQPWASRRLVPVVLPGFIMLAVWTVAWAGGKLRTPGRRRGTALSARGTALSAHGTALSARGTAAAGVAAACAVLLVVPAALGARGTALKRTYANQVAAISGLCDRVPGDASVLIIDGPAADRWAEVVRGMCDVPVARFPDSARPSSHPEAPAALVSAAIAGIERAGRRPVLLAATRAELAPFAGKGTITHAVNLPTTGDGRYLLSRPYNVTRGNLTAWMWEPNR
jgi:hypothetical protein